MEPATAVVNSQPKDFFAQGVWIVDPDAHDRMTDPFQLGP